MENTPLIEGMINIIKLVRSCSDLGLASAKVIAVEWANNYFLEDWKVYDFEIIKKLLKAVGHVVRGEWTIDTVKGEIRVERKISNLDWENL